MISSYHLFTLFLSLLTITAFTLTLYSLACMLFSTNVEENLSIEKLYSYECGYSPFSDARDAFDIKFYLVAILFLIFDLEILFLIPLTVALVSIKLSEFLLILLFLFILTVGFIYEWKRGGLDW